MKKFTLGFILGASAGLLASFLKNEDGSRVGAPLKAEFDGLKDDFQDLSNGVNSAKNALADLEKNLPDASKTIDEIGNDIRHYQDQSSRTIEELEKATDNLEQKMQQNFE